MNTDQKPKSLNKATKSIYSDYLQTSKNKHQFDELSNKIIGAAIQVHKELGPGFIEGIYEAALKVQLTELHIPFENQINIIVKFHGTNVGKHRLDLLINKQIVVELKAVKELLDIHVAQLRSYLKATRLKTGLLINFAKPVIEIKRVVN
jgi:GxxExxY protein